MLEMKEWPLREAKDADLKAINAIYNHYVQHSDCTLQTEVSTAAERAAWFAARGSAHPILVAEDAGEVVGWGALVRFSDRGGYRFTVEDSIYLRHDRTGQGLGTTLLEALLARAVEAGHHSVIARITATQAASLKLHHRHGFVQAALLKEAGWKFERWVDVVFLQRSL